MTDRWAARGVKVILNRNGVGWVGNEMNGENDVAVAVLDFIGGSRVVISENYEMYDVLNCTEAKLPQVIQDSIKT